MSLSYNGGIKNITIDGNTTIEKLISDINTTTGGSIIANFDESTGRFSIRSKETGSDANIKIPSKSKDSKDNDDLILKTLGITVENTTGGGKTASGRDSIVEITPLGSSTITMTQKSNNFTVGVILKVTVTWMKMVYNYLTTFQSGSYLT